MKNGLLVGAVSACLLQPMIVSAQTMSAHLPLLPTRVSIDQNVEGPLMNAVRRQLAADYAQLAASRAGDADVTRAFNAGQASGAQAVGQPREKRGWIGRHPALFGALVGAAAGTIAAGTMENELFCSAGNDEDCLFYTSSRFAVGAGIGAGIGALAGWIVSLGR